MSGDLLSSVLFLREARRAGVAQSARATTRAVVVSMLGASARTHRVFVAQRKSMRPAALVRSPESVRSEQSQPVIQAPGQDRDNTGEIEKALPVRIRGHQFRGQPGRLCDLGFGARMPCRFLH
jgi:hypothetical protein